MSIELSKEARDEAISSIERYFQEELEQRIGNIAAGALLDFVLQEIGPCVYNQAVADVQERVQARLLEIDIELHKEPFTHGRR